MKLKDYFNVNGFNGNLPLTISIMSFLNINGVYIKPKQIPTQESRHEVPVSLEAVEKFINKTQDLHFSDEMEYYMNKLYNAYRIPSHLFPPNKNKQ